ncbi:MAG: hypothetical protein IIA67_00100 [Planctomycetes bacterium]|nr:hypothetical protein [Planctomycetota bacterium]
METGLPPAKDAFQPLRLRFSLIHLLTVMTVMTVLLGVARWEIRMLPFLQVALVLAGVAVCYKAGARASAMVGAAVCYVLLGALVFFGLMPLLRAMKAAWFSFVMAAPATLAIGASIGYFYGAFNDRRRLRERRANRADLQSEAPHADRG